MDIIKELDKYYKNQYVKFIRSKNPQQKNEIYANNKNYNLYFKNVFYSVWKKYYESMGLTVRTGGIKHEFL